MQVHKAQDVASRRGKLTTEDIMFLVRKVLSVRLCVSLKFATKPVETSKHVNFHLLLLNCFQVILVCKQREILQGDLPKLFLFFFWIAESAVQGKILPHLIPQIFDQFLCIWTQDARKFARVKELLAMNEELKRARKAFEVDEDKLANDYWDSPQFLVLFK